MLIPWYLNSTFFLCLEENRIKIHIIYALFVLFRFKNLKVPATAERHNFQTGCVITILPSPPSLFSWLIDIDSNDGSPLPCGEILDFGTLCDSPFNPWYYVRQASIIQSLI